MSQTESTNNPKRQKAHDATPPLNSALTVFETADAIASLEREILFPVHYDGISPGQQDKKKDRVQAFLQFQNEPSENDHARATIFVKDSHLHLHLFTSYYFVYCDITGKDSPGPVWMSKFTLNDFNRELSVMKALVASESSAKKGAKVSAKLKQWRSKVSADEVSAAPAQFAWMLVNFRDRDLLVWRCGMLHAVLNARRAKIVRIKVYLDIYSTSHESEIDESGFAASGGTRSLHRKFELTRFADMLKKQKQSTKVDQNAAKKLHGSAQRDHERPEEEKQEKSGIDQRSLAEATVTGKAFLRIPENTDNLITLPDSERELQASQAKQLIADMQAHGISVIRDALPESDTTMCEVADYLHELMGFPEGVDFLDSAHARCFHDKKVRAKFNVTNKMLRRNENNTHSQHVPRKNGSCRYGVCSKAAIRACAYVAPLFNELYSALFGEDCTPKLYAVDTSLQVPV